MKNLIKVACYGIVLGTLTVGTAFAKEGGKDKEAKGKKPTPAELFAKMDADGSGEVTLEEFTAGAEKRRARMKERMGDKQRPADAPTPPTPEEAFTRMDTNGDGVLTEEEIKKRGPRGQKGKKHGKKEKTKKGAEG